MLFEGSGWTMLRLARFSLHMHRMHDEAVEDASLMDSCPDQHHIAINTSPLSRCSLAGGS